MKIFALIVLLFALTSCASSHKYEQEKNCSPRALEHLKKSPVTQLDLKSQMAVDAKILMDSISLEAKRCYQASIDREDVKEYQLCTVISTDEKGVLNFIDIDDYTTRVPLELNTCLMDIIIKLDFKKVPSINIIQPINLFLRKRTN